MLYTTELCFAKADQHCHWRLDDDTYVTVPAVNIQSHETELVNVEWRADSNNLRLNLQKSVDVIFFEQDEDVTLAHHHLRLV